MSPGDRSPPAGPTQAGPRDHWWEHLPLLLDPQLVLSLVLISKRKQVRREHGHGGSRLLPTQIGKGCQANSHFLLTKTGLPLLSASQGLPDACL